MIRQRLAGLAATLGILTLLIGLPALLLRVGFGTLPPIHNPTDLANLLSRPDDGTIALVAIKAIGWATCALLAGLIGLEIIARLRGIRPPALPGLRLPQNAAAQLVAAAAVLFVALPPTPIPAHAAPPTPPGASATRMRTPTRGEPAPAPHLPATGGKPVGDAAATRPVNAVRYTVRRGDTLWSIAAAHLGDGRRYTEIAALNTHLLNGKGDDFLRAGWTLTLPAQHTPGDSPAQSTSYTVRPGDTLSEIALDYLGDAADYPQIVAASRHITQPDGQHLTDPDLIDIGWTLEIPDTEAATPATPEPTHLTPTTPVVVPHSSPAAPSPDASTASNPPTASLSPAPLPARQEPAPDATPSRATADPHPGPTAIVEDVSLTTPSWVVPGLVGAGALLGGSLWLALRRRRAAQIRARRPGRMIAPPPPELRAVEKTLRTEGDAAALDVEFIDQTLRRLAARQGRASQPMPPVAAAETSDELVRLHLAEPADLPDPWQQAPDRLRWQIPTTTELAEIGPLDAALPAPYPQLVTLGTDAGGHRWLYNLEEAAVIRVTGDRDHARDFSRQLVAELAVHPWASDVQVECVGVASEAVALNPRRIRHHNTSDTSDITSSVIADTVSMIDRTREAGLDIATGRATLHDDPLWDSRLLILDTRRTDLTDQLARLLNGHARHAGTAMVLIATAEPEQDRDAQEIHLTSDGRLQLPGVGLDLQAAGLTATELAGCAAIFAQADQPDVDIPDHPEPADGWRAYANQAGQVRHDHTLPRDQSPTETATTVLPDDDRAYLEVAATTPDDIATLAPHVPTRIRGQLERDDPTLDADVDTWFDPHCDLPRLMTLGPLTVRVAPTGKPATAAGRRPYFTELLAYLATRPYGATTEEVADAMRIPTDRVRKDILALRNWLGINPRTRRPHIPDSRQTQAAQARGKAAYQLEGVLVDADLFRRLRVRGETRGPAGLDDLRRALDLVHGVPFAQLRRGGGAWLSDGDRLDQILQCAIVDVAHLVSTAVLTQGNLAEAQRVAELAARVAPDEDIPQLDLAAVLAAHGHHHAAEQFLRERICDRGNDEDEVPSELSVRTGQVLDRRQWLARPRSKRSA